MSELPSDLRRLQEALRQIVERDFDGLDNIGTKQAMRSIARKALKSL